MRMDSRRETGGQTHLGSLDTFFLCVCTLCILVDLSHTGIDHQRGPSVCMGQRGVYLDSPVAAKIAVSAWSTNVGHG